MTNEQICAKKMTTCKILFTYVSKNKKSKQIYTIDTTKQVPIGGMSEKGYMLNLWPENTKSGNCMTYSNILRVLSGKVIEQHVFQVQIIK